jgi:hypothetical protein
LAIVLLISGLIGLDAYALLYSFWHPWSLVYQPTTHLSGPFSAYYNGAWSLIHNPTDLYDASTSFPIANGEGFRYPPYFLLFVLPFLRLQFVAALQAFATFQFLLLPLIAILVWKILSPKSLKEYALLAAVLFMTLWTPLDGVIGNLVPATNPYYLSHGISAAYLLQFQTGESKILELCIILGAIYCAKRNSILGGFLLVLSAFDPRFTLMAVPLFAYFVYQNKGYTKALKGIGLAILLFVVPFVFYYNALGQYFALSQYNVTTFYAYEWIPFYSLLFFSLAYFAQEYFRKQNLKKQKAPMSAGIQARPEQSLL